MKPNPTDSDDLSPEEREVLEYLKAQELEAVERRYDGPGRTADGLLHDEGDAVALAEVSPAARALPLDHEPVYFGSGGTPLYGCFHPAHAAPREGAALAICQPIGAEYIRCHRSLRVLAKSLASSGVSVLRFDYYGCGDSRGDGEEVTLDRCAESVGEAVRYLRGRTRALRVDLLGIRLGAALALRYAAGCHGQVGRIALWDPVVRGEDFLASMREQGEDFKTWLQRLVGRAPSPEESDGVRDLMGFRFSEKMIEELEGLDLMAVDERPCGRALVLDNGDEPAVAGLRDRLTEVGVSVELERLSSPRIWLAAPYQGLVPRQSLDLLARWFLE